MTHGMNERAVVDSIVSAALLYELPEDRRRATIRSPTPASEPIVVFGPVTKRTAARFAVG